MIKKLLFTAAFIIAGTVLLNAQCTIDQSCVKLVCPDTNTATGGNLPHATPGFLYSTSLTVRIPTDTTLSGVAVHVDTLSYTSITGLPTGFTATPNQPLWLGGTKGCLLIQGTAADSMQGKKYNLVITVTIYGFYFSVYHTTMPYPLNGYRIRVDSSNGIGNFDLNKFKLEQNSPNPFSKTITIAFTSPNSETYTFSVMNVIGEKVFEKNIIASIGENKIEFSASELPSGIYMYKLSNKEQSVTRRMIVAGK